MKTKDWNKDFYIDNEVLYNENEYFVIEGFIKWFLSDDDRKNLIDEDEISYYDKENNKGAFCMVYSGVLRELVLSNVDIKATRVFTSALENRFENMIATINTAYLFEYYTKGYRQGLEDFNREYKIVSKDLLSNNCQSFIDDLRDKYFNVRTRFGKGWQSIKGFFPLRFHYSDIKILGYYAGLIASTDEMIQQMPTLFEGFYNNPDDAFQVDGSEPIKEKGKKGKKEKKDKKREREINKDLLFQYLVKNFSMCKAEISSGTTKFDFLVEDLRKNFNKQEIGQIALMIYDSGIMNENLKPSDFKNWRNTFCDIVGSDPISYDKNKLNPNSKIKKIFHYLHLNPII